MTCIIVKLMHVSLCKSYCYLQFLCTQVFFINHEHELTTFIESDPCLPLPNQQFTYTPIQNTAPARQTSYDNTGLRPHTTTIRHSQSLDSGLAVGQAAPTTLTTPLSQGASLAPPTLSNPPSQGSSSRNELTVPGASASSAGGNTSSARSSVSGKSAAPPSEFVCLPTTLVWAPTCTCNWWGNNRYHWAMCMGCIG